MCLEDSLWEHKHAYFADAKQTFHLYVKKGTEEVATKDLDQLFKAMALHVDDDKLKDWADEMDEDGII